MRNYDIAQVLWHETGKMNYLYIFRTKKNKNKGTESIKPAWFPWRYAQSHLTDFNGIYKNSYYGYYEKIRCFSQCKESEVVQLWTAGIQ